MNEQRNIKNQDQILKYNPVFVLLRFLYISRPFECGNIIISEISVLRATQEMEKKKKANRKSWRDVLCKRRNPMDVLRPRTFVETVFLCNGMAFFFVKPDLRQSDYLLMATKNTFFWAQGFRHDC